MRELVLDVSHWDGDVDYGRWRDQHGLWGVIVKCGGNEGGRYRDGWFESNYADARTVGLHVGAYYYTTATDAGEAADDARHCLSLISDKDFDLPVYIDVEDAGQATIGRRALTDVVLAFIRIIEDAGYSGGVYTSGSWWANNVYADELRPYANWIAWWTAEKPDAISDVGMWQFGSMRLSDGDVQHDDVGGYTDANYCYVDYPAQRGGQPDERGRVTHIDCAERAALIHYDMVVDDRNGYSQAPVRWGGDYGGDATVQLPGGDVSYPLGSYDCSSSVCRAWHLALVGSPYEGALDEASYTGNMREVFLNSGLFYGDRTPARRGDVYLNDGHHTAMCQDGGLGDGPFGYDCLSHFRGNEWGGIYDGEPGDQTGEEALVQPFYEAWAVTLHYNHRADWDLVENQEPAEPQQPGEPTNDAGLWYCAHVEDHGWLPSVHDGQVAGTVGQSRRLEAIKIAPPEGWTLFAKVHLQDVGWVLYEDITGPMDSAEVIGTTGESRRIEDIIIGVSQRPEGDTRHLEFRVHQQDVSWKAWTEEGYASGTDGMSIRLEAVQMRLVD